MILRTAGVLLLVSGIAFAIESGDSDLERAIAERFERVPLSHLPTPLEELSALSAEIGGPRLYIKRDDQTGLAFGGNKARKLEFIFADVVDKKADVIITWAGVQSNWARQTTAAARKLGIRPILLLAKREDGRFESGGNLLLDALMDADIRLVEAGTDQSALAAQIAEEEKAKGHRPYVVPVGGSRVLGDMTEPLGAIAYANGFAELARQGKENGFNLTHLVTATGSGGTQAGLVVGAKALGGEVEVIGVSISRKKKASQDTVAAIANDTAAALGLELTFTPEEIVVWDDYLGEGYGFLNDGITEAIALLAQKEGILIDPVYTGKAMAGLIDRIRKGHFEPDDGVVFLHTGGTPTLFVYQDELLERLRSRGSPPSSH